MPNPMARKAKLDETLAGAVDRAREALLEIAAGESIGAHVEVVCDGERLVTHRFEATVNGYGGWHWYATLSRIPRAKAQDITVCEVGLLPGPGALLAPAWVPWAARVRPEELAQEQEEAAAEAAALGEVLEGDDLPADEAEVEAAAETEADEA